MRKGVPVSVDYQGLRVSSPPFLSALARCRPSPISSTRPGKAPRFEESNLSVQIAALRKLLGQTPEGGDWITTVPRVGYRFAQTLDSDARGADARGDAKIALAHRPSVAVLPFANVGGEREQEYFADGITEDIITALAASAGSSSSRGIRASFTRTSPSKPGRSRVNWACNICWKEACADPVRAFVSRRDWSTLPTNTQIWAERYDLALAEVFAIQDEIAERVAGAIEPELLEDGIESRVAATHRQHDRLGLVRQGTWRFHQVARPTHHEARELFREACRLDPDLPEAQFGARASLSG